MPTPFSHLKISERLLTDALVPQELRTFLGAYRADFLLGGIIADARPESGKRGDTHFYEYNKPMPDNPWREMFRQYPSLLKPQSEAHKAFLMAYVAHLASDEYWSRYMLHPHFALGEWGEGLRERFFMLHFLLIAMDERDEALLSADVATCIRASEPLAWLPFLKDETIRDWRDYIAMQLESESETLQVFGARIETSPEDIRALLGNTETMQKKLWQHITPSLLAEIEAALYDFSREQMLIYWESFQS